jgi:hypothetical protein
VPTISEKGYYNRRQVGCLSSTRSCQLQRFCKCECLVILYSFTDLVDFLGLAVPGVVLQLESSLIGFFFLTNISVFFIVYCFIYFWLIIIC